VKKTPEMTENWTTEEDSQWPTDLPVPATTLGRKQQTTGHQNTTSSHVVPDKQWSSAEVVGVVMLLAFIVVVIWHKCASASRKTKP
jgi:hypothetical protein